MVCHMPLTPVYHCVCCGSTSGTDLSQETLHLQVQTKTLENLRRLKTRHQRLLSAVTTVRKAAGCLKNPPACIRLVWVERCAPAAHWCSQERLCGSLQGGMHTAKQTRAPLDPDAGA